MILLAGEGGGQNKVAAAVVREMAFPVPLGEGIPSWAIETIAPPADAQVEHAVRVALPPNSTRWAAKRTAAFVAGRYCAQQVLKRIGHSDADIPIGSDGGPVWPSGFVGSITHTDGFAAAVIAQKNYVVRIGIDSEPIIPAADVDEIATRICPELHGQSVNGLDWAMLVTLAFSAKESLYKCLRPLVGEFFGFTDVKITDLDLKLHTLQMTTVRDLTAAFPRGRTIPATFSIATGIILHTGVCIRPS